MTITADPATFSSGAIVSPAPGRRLARRSRNGDIASLPEEVIARTREKYIEAFRRLTDRELQ